MASIVLLGPCVGVKPFQRQCQTRSSRSWQNFSRLPMPTGLLQKHPASRVKLLKRVAVQSPRLWQLRAAETDAVPAGQVMDATWDEMVMNSAVPVLVDFWAPWCGPCRMVEPTVDELGVEYGDKLKVLKLNTDLNPQTATAYGIRSIPTIILFKDGKAKGSVIGAVPKATLVQMLEKFIEN